jgi:predicted amidohydrolase YtcJ
MTKNTDRTMRVGVVRAGIFGINHAATPDAMLHRYITHARLNVETALPAYTSTPARLLGDKQRGALGAGMRGDVAVFESNGTVAMTFVDGRLVYAARSVTTDPDTNFNAG